MMKLYVIFLELLYMYDILETWNMLLHFTYVYSKMYYILIEMSSQAVYFLPSRSFLRLTVMTD